jgi:hypothetical protein
MKTPSLVQALEPRIKSREDSYKRDEIYLLGCLARREIGWRCGVPGRSGSLL